MFSLNWFTSIPGILITIGVLLLIVALIIFIVTSRKNKKKGQDTENGNTVLQTVDQNLVAPSPTITPVDNSVPQTSIIGQTASAQPVSQIPPVNNTMPSPYSNPVIDNNSNISMNSTTTAPIMNNNGSIYSSSSNVSAMPEQPYNQSNITPDMNISSPVMPPIAPEQDFVSNPVSMEVSAEPMMNATPTVPQVEVPIVQPVDSINSIEGLNINTNENVANIGVSDNIQPNIVQQSPIPIVQPTISDIPTVNETISPSMPVVESVSMPSPVIMPEVSNSIDNINSNNINNTQQENTSISEVSAPIYGGVSPIVPEVSKMQNTPQIYGGANPLENTQSVPISQIASDINQLNNDSVSNVNMNQIAPQTVSDIPTPQIQLTPVMPTAPNPLQQEIEVSVPQSSNPVQSTPSSMPENLSTASVVPGVTYQAPMSAQQSVTINPNVQ